MAKKKTKRLAKKNPCTAGYVPYGMKTKNGRKVPNCGKKR